MRPMAVGLVHALNWRLTDITHIQQKNVRKYVDLRTDAKTNGSVRNGNVKGTWPETKKQRRKPCWLRVFESEQVSTLALDCWTTTATYSMTQTNWTVDSLQYATCLGSPQRMERDGRGKDVRLHGARSATPRRVSRPTTPNREQKRRGRRATCNWQTIKYTRWNLVNTLFQQHRQIRPCLETRENLRPKEVMKRDIYIYIYIYIYATLSSQPHGHQRP